MGTRREKLKKRSGLEKNKSWKTGKLPLFWREIWYKSDKKLGFLTSYRGINQFIADYRTGAFYWYWKDCIYLGSGSSNCTINVDSSWSLSKRNAYSIVCLGSSFFFIAFAREVASQTAKYKSRNLLILFWIIGLSTP